MRSKTVLTVLLLCLFTACTRQNESTLVEAVRNSPAKESDSKQAFPTPQPTSTAASDDEIDTSELDKIEADTLPFAERIPAPEKLIKRMLLDSKEMRKCLKEDYENDFPTFSEHIVSQFLDLNEDKINDYIISIENRCSGHNSPYFIYQSVKNKQVLLLNTVSNGIRVEKSKTNGFHNLLVSSHHSCCSGAYDIYKFKAGKYRLSECFVWESVDTENGKKRAEVKPHKCGEPT